MNYAEEIKDRVSMKDVAGYYGLEINRNGFALCPFHQERTPSFKIYADAYHCYGCGAHGDVIDFVMKQEGTGFQQACETINRAFSLGLPIGEKPRPAEAREAAKQAFLKRRARNEERRAVEDAETAFWAAYDAWLDNHTILDRNAPKTEEEAFSEEYATAVSRATVLEWELEQAEIRLYEAGHKNYN